MAAAEMRAVWQRTANRCFVQEDAKRAPKLACCQPPCAASKSVDAGPAIAADDESDRVAVNVTPFNRKSSFLNLTPDSRWWLHLQQPNHGFQKGLTYEQLNALLQDEVEISKAGDGNNKACKRETFDDENHDSFDYVHCDFTADITKETTKGRMMQEAYSMNSQAFPGLMPMDVMAQNDKFKIDSIGCSVSKQTNEFSLDSEYIWIEGDKAQPWWRTTDRNELASFVSQKSLNRVENCDLPPPRKYLRGRQCANISDEKIRTASFDWEASLDSTLMQRKQGLSAENRRLHFACEKSPSSYSTIHDDITEQVFEGNPSKAQLMEALCRSQTRGREAEEAVKKAQAEKEHAITLFFKQASQLFAYKQWFHLLLLENLHIQLLNKDQMTLPWMSSKGAKPRKRKHKFVNGKQGMENKPRKCDITTYAVAFALGLSPFGAGLILGWSVGWMLPSL